MWETSVSGLRDFLKVYWPLIAVALLVSSILLIYVVPQFEEVFKGFGADLPAGAAAPVGG